jgi:hypothetical protein
MPGIFISYRREDSIAYAGRLYDRLSAQFGEEQVFMDVDTIEPGSDFVEVITQKVGSCEALVAVIGREWLNARDEEGRRRLDNPKDLVRLEIAAALERNVRVIPVLVGGAHIPRSQDLPEALAALLRRHAMEITDVAFNQGVTRLVQSLGKVFVEREGQEPSRESIKGKDARIDPLRFPVAIGSDDITTIARRRHAPAVQVQPSSWLRRWLLLYKPVRWWAWLPRICFYFCVFYCLFFLVAFPLILNTEQTGFMPLLTNFGIGLGSSVFVVLIALPFRVLSRIIEGPRPLKMSDLVLAKGVGENRGEPKETSKKDRQDPAEKTTST